MQRLKLATSNLEHGSAHHKITPRGKSSSELPDPPKFKCFFLISVMDKAAEFKFDIGLKFA